MTAKAVPLPLFLFDTTHHALWAEDVARKREIPAEVVPAPADAKAKCALALQCLAVNLIDLEGALTEEGVSFHRYERALA